MKITYTESKAIELHEIAEELIHLDYALQDKGKWLIKVTAHRLVPVPPVKPAPKQK